VGSGLVINSLQMLLSKERKGALFYGTDINLMALDATRRTAEKNNC
jgi:methylase of polypeptide subunit release factors